MATDEAILNDYLAKGIAAAEAAGALIREGFYKPKRIDTKSAVTDLVTETDQNAERTIFELLRNSYPDHHFVGEETTAATNESERGVKLTDTPTWIVDPLDGTTNFVHQFPHVCVSIGLLINKEPAVAIIYNPILGELFTGVKGHGAFLSNTLLPNFGKSKLSVSGQSELSLALIATEYGSDRSTSRIDAVQTMARKILDHPCHGIRSLGSAALQMAFVSAGRLDAYYEAGIHCWDIAAGTLLVREAGGVVVDFGGDVPVDLLSRRVLCAATQQLASTIASKLTPIELQRD